MTSIRGSGVRRGATEGTSTSVRLGPLIDVSGWFSCEQWCEWVGVPVVRGAVPVSSLGER